MEAAKKADPAMMRGSEGHLDYLVLAKRGKYQLGLKVAGLGPAPGGNTTLAIRLRSAPDPEHEPSTVISLADSGLDMRSAWPSIKWEQANNERASVVMGTVLPGHPGKDPTALVQGLGQVPEKISAHVMSLVSEQHLVVSQEEVLAWVTDRVGEITKKVNKLASIEQKASEAAGSGVFDTQQGLLKKMYGGEDSGAGDEPEDEDDEE